jgi:hypothetical protein
VTTTVTEQYLRYDSDSGNLYLRKLLTGHVPPASFVLTIYARDQRRVNEKTGTSTISITLDFDSPPVFNPKTYSRVIPESFSVGGDIVDTDAFDSDIIVSRYYLYATIEIKPFEFEML